MTTTKQKKTSSASELAYIRTFGYQPRDIRIPGQTDSIQSDFLIDTSEFDLQHEAIQRKKLYAALQIAKQNNDQIMINKIENELGLKKVNGEDEKQTEEIKEILNVLRQQLLDPNLTDEQHNRVLKSIAGLSIGTKGSLAAITALTSTTAKPVEPKADIMGELTKDLLKSLIEKKTDESKESDMDKFIKYQKFLNENTPNSMDIIKDAKETLAAVGVDITGSKNMAELQLSLEKMKIDNDNTFRMKELDVKQEQTKAFGGWIKDLSTAVIESAIDSMGDDEEETETKKETNEKSTDRQEMKVRCFGCKKLFKIENPEKTREVVCEKCSWPHYWESDKRKAMSITPDDVKAKMNQDTEEFLKDYQPGQLEEMIKGQNEEEV